MVGRVYELTTNAKDGFAKWYVRGIENDAEALKIAKEGFGRFATSSNSLNTYYDNHPSINHGSNYWLKNSFTIKEFLKRAKKEYAKKEKE